MRIINYLSVVTFVLAIISCGGNPQKDNQETKTLKNENKEFNKQMLTKAKAFFAALPETAENPENPVSDEKLTLGKLLYFDSQLSKDGNISCNSCHNLETFGVDNLPTSPGDDGTLGTRNSPTVFNAALHTSQFWDGRARDVEEQAGMPIMNPVEMAMTSEKFVIDRIQSSKMYIDLFNAAFPEEENPVSYINVGKAIGAFERTLITPAKFDDFLGGNLAAMSETELKGMDAFINNGCIACHRGSVLGGDMMQKFSIFGNYWDHTGSKNIDKGKFEETKKAGDEFLFKVSALRNVEKTAPYFHDGSVKELERSIEIMGITELNKELSKEDLTLMVEFLKTLTGDIPDETKKAPENLDKLYVQG